MDRKKVKKVRHVPPKVGQLVSFGMLCSTERGGKENLKNVKDLALNGGSLRHFS